MEGPNNIMAHNADTEHLVSRNGAGKMISYFFRSSAILYVVEGSVSSCNSAPLREEGRPINSDRAISAGRAIVSFAAHRRPESNGAGLDR